MMPHRSDEEALRAKLDERDRELADAERKLRQAKDENDRLRRGKSVRPQPLDARALPGGPRGLLLASLVAILVAGLGAGFFLLSRPAPSPWMAPPPPPIPYPPPIPPGAVPPSFAPPVVVRVGARAIAVSGDTTVRVGDACDVTATIAPAPTTELRDVTIACAGTRLYGFHDPISGISMSELSAVAWPGDAPETLRYEITLSDTGARTMRPEAILSSWSGEGAVFRTGLGAFRVDLELDPVSDEVPVPPGSAIRFVPGLPHHALRHGRVVSAEPPGLAAGTECRIAVRPMPGNPALNTRTHVRCGTATLYGSGTAGLALRTGDTISDVGTTAEDGDPAMALDLAAGTLSIRDTRNGVNETIEITLDPETSPAPAAPPAGPMAPASPTPTGSAGS